MVDDIEEQYWMYEKTKITLKNGIIMNINKIKTVTTQIYNHISYLHIIQRIDRLFWKFSGVKIICIEIFLRAHMTVANSYQIGPFLWDSLHDSFLWGHFNICPPLFFHLIFTFCWTLDEWVCKIALPYCSYKNQIYLKLVLEIGNLFSN